MSSDTAHTGDITQRRANIAIDVQPALSRPAAAPTTPAAPNAPDGPEEPAALIPASGVFSHVTVANGLVDPIVFDVEFDPYGFAWVATQAGLQRWNGRSFDTFESDPADPTTNGPGAVFDLAPAADGSVWTVGAITSRYDPITGTFERFEFNATDVYVASNENVYVTIGAELAVYRDELGRFETLGTVESNSDLTTLEIVGESAAQQLILLTGDELFSFDLQRGQLELIEGSQAPTDTVAPESHVVLNSVIWRVSPDLREFHRFDLATGQFIEPVRPPLPEGDNVITAAVGPDGQYWIGTSQSGLLRFDGQNYYQYRHNRWNDQSLASDRVFPFLVDDDGSVWISTPGLGIDIYQPAAQGIYRLFAESDGHEVTNSTVWDLFVDSSDNLWIGHDRGADVFDLETATVRHIGQGLVDGTTPFVSGRGNVSAFAEDPNGNMWLGTYGGGLHYLDTETGFTELVGSGDTLRRVPALLMHSDGYLLAGSSYKGIYRIDPQTQTVEQIVAAPPATNQWSPGVFVEAPNGDIWAGMWNGGLLKIDPHTSQVTEHYPSGSQTDSTWALAIDDNELWAGMSRGLAKLDLSTGDWEYFEIRVDGRRRSIYGIIIEDNRLWVSTEIGIHQIDRTTQQVTSTYSELGATGLGFTQSAYARHESQLYFGGGAGLSVVDLTQLRPFPQPNATFITQVTVNDVDLAPGGEILEKRAIVTDSIVLPADTLSFALRFVAPSYLEPERVNYHYRMVGFNDEWSTAEPLLPRASYTNLDPGNYRFEVYAVSPASQVGPTRTLLITIRPYWWETTWFRVGALIMVLALVGASIAWGVRRVRRRHIELTERLAEREQHAADLERMNARVQRDSEQISMLMDSVPGGVALLDGQNRVLVMRIQHNQPEIIPGLREGEIFEGVASFSADELRAVQKQWLNIRVGPDSERTVAIHAVTPPERPEQHWVLAYQDVSDEIAVRSRAETQGRLAALGQFAAGIAHDLNNVLAVISLSAELIDNRPTADDAQFHARQVAEQVLTARDMIRQILDFSSSSHLTVEPVLAAEIFAGIVATGQRMLGPTIECGLQIDPNVTESWVSIDRVRIQQMMYNLFTNARDAIVDGGQISVDVSRIALKDIPAGVLGVSDVADPTSMYVRVAVTDTGTGITDEVLATMFEPFQTTKPKGSGVGLGLGQVYGIVRLHRGLISVDTELGVGTTIAVHFPEFGVDPVADAGANIEEVAPRLAGARSVLLVDDNVALLSLITTALSGAGYDVDGCSNGQTALQRWTQRRHDVIVTDLLMPGMSGEELILRTRAIDPDVAVVLITGNPGLRLNATDSDDRGPIVDVELLVKPVHRDALIDAIERAIRTGVTTD